MKKLGDQWIEVIDGKEHMLKCTSFDDDMSIISKDLGVLKDGLLPCPFCGEYPNLENNGYFWYCCTNADCLAEVRTGKTKQEAIDIWNRRT